MRIAQSSGERRSLGESHNAAFTANRPLLAAYRFLPAHDLLLRLPFSLPHELG